MKFILKEISLSLILILICTKFISAQIDSTGTSKEDIIEEIISENESDADKEGLGDLIEELLNNPVDLNSASISELQSIPNLSLSDARAIVNYRTNSGILFSTSQLYLIKDLPQEKIKYILPFVTVNKMETITTDKMDGTPLIKVNFRNRISEDVQPQDGFIKNKFLGNKYRTYNRLMIKYNQHIKIGGLIEKDPGEKSYNDFTSAYISINKLSVFNKIIVGDYLVEFGQGLAMWGPYSFSKSSNAVYPVKKNPKFLREYTSSDENRFFRGISARIDYKLLSFSLFYSKNNFDANIDSADQFILSTSVDGYHRTETELSRKNSAAEQMLGGILNFSPTPETNFGFLFYHSSVDHNFSSQNIYGLKGNSFNFYSFNYDLYYNNINLSGESSFNGKSLASIINIQFDVSKDFSIITSLRNYPRNYYNLHSNGFGGQGGSTQNEFGIYNGIKWRTNIGIINFYYDQFKFPFATYSNPLPTSGDEVMINYFTKPVKNLSASLRIKNLNREVSYNSFDQKEIFNQEKTSLRFEMEYNSGQNLILKSRIELNRFTIKEINKKENGYMIFQDVRFLPARSLYLGARIIFFKTGSFDTAVYEFENDLDGVFALNSLYGLGTRWYAVIKYKLLNYLKLSLKYSETYKPLVKSMRSGLTEIPGNLDNRISAQIDFEF